MRRVEGKRTGLSDRTRKGARGGGGGGGMEEG